jgi:hypothetical protein
MAGSGRGLLDFIVYKKEETPKRNSDGQPAAVFQETARGVLPYIARSGLLKCVYQSGTEDVGVQAAAVQMWQQ